MRFEAALARELRGLRDGAILAHMCPIYATLAAPFARPLGIPVLLWFSHWRTSRLLRTAERAASAVVTVDPRSFPLHSDKLQAIGHGIDLSEFPCTSRGEHTGPLRVLALGRYSPAKGLEVVLRALVEVDARLTVHGPVLTDEELAHRRELEGLVDRLGLHERVRLGDAIPRTRVPSLLAASDVLVNNMRPGAPDKVVYEAAASGLPVLASNPVFDDLLAPEHRFARDDPVALARRLRELAALPASARAELGRRLHERVAERHSVESWADGILAAAGLS
jgi:glycosyltransferase involved in cell wall biosynthesis